MKMLICFTLLFIFNPAWADDSLKQSLLRDIQNTQQQLQKTQARIGNDRQALSQQVQTLEQEVLALREKTAVARRQADEKTLALANSNNVYKNGSNSRHTSRI